MGLFETLLGKKTQENKEFSITPEDKRWVDVCYKWLLKTFGYPSKEAGPILFAPKYFPITHQDRKVTANNLLADLCNLYLIDGKKVSFTLIPDIRDIPNTPHQIQGRAFESDLDIISGESGSPQYVIHIANSLVYREYLLLRRLILELTKIKIYEENPELVSGANLAYFTYIAAVYFGFGVLISRALVEIGVEYKGGWQKTWRTKSEVPYQVVSYALASYSKLIGDENPSWKSNLPADVVEEYDSAMQYLVANPDETTYFDKTAFENDLKARQHQANAMELVKSKQFDEAVKEYELAISLATDKYLLSQLYINMGYRYLMAENYEKSLPCYLKALELQPGYDYALANMGYIYTMTEQLEKAKECLEKVEPYDNILKAYLLRDWALYYMKMGNDELAHDYFKKTFDTKTSVDLLE
ncbi:MAG TPA: tetratricopeptide repeat protein, partial [Bacteroidia bacterium]|nr:tetratricopeptide repeat protein [Bacteroidia bacterium]